MVPDMSPESLPLDVVAGVGVAVIGLVGGRGDNARAGGQRRAGRDHDRRRALGGDQLAPTGTGARDRRGRDVVGAPRRGRQHELGARQERQRAAVRQDVVGADRRARRDVPARADPGRVHRRAVVRFDRRRDRTLERHPAFMDRGSVDRNNTPTPSLPTAFPASAAQPATFAVPSGIRPNALAS